MTTPDALPFYCAPMRTRSMVDPCQGQRAAGRDYCVKCPRGIGISSGKFRNMFVSSHRFSKKVETLLLYPPFQTRHEPPAPKPPKPIKEKLIKIKKHLEKREVKPGPINRYIGDSLLAKCPNCGHPVTGKHRFCGLCEKAHALPLEGMRKARLPEVKHLRETGQVPIGRPPGYRPTDRG